MRTAALASALAAALVAAAGSAEAVHERDAQIRPSVGIGKLRLGMTVGQVRRVLGPPQLLNRKVRLGFGREHREYVWNWFEWSVAFRGAPGRLRVVRVTTTLRNHRYRGIGVGSRMRDLVRVFPTAICRGYSQTETQVLVRTRGGRQLRFKIVEPYWRRPGVAPSGPIRVADVIVQEALPPLGVQVRANDPRNDLERGVRAYVAETLTRA
jgi:hypothetical protein